MARAVTIADEEGLDAVSMRRLAEALDVGTMSLYTHIPGKSELTDLMIDAAYGELYESVEEAQRQPGGYRERLHFVAERNKALYARHPWLLDVPLGRPVLGPHAAMKYETELRVLDGIGLTAPEMDSTEALLVMHVQATARLRVARLRAQNRDGMTEMEWWMATVPLLLRVKPCSFRSRGASARPREKPWRRGRPTITCFASASSSSARGWPRSSRATRRRPSEDRTATASSDAAARSPASSPSIRDFKPGCKT